ncbi:MAG: formylglycine-generating enzyme family protein [Clostridia bacterium]|nr:formylglycine-generating enzyme family protein [Clostridia bacterium]
MGIITSVKDEKQEKMNKGITLIALVITIIVLLILAGISIATLTGENGVLTKANTGKEETLKASAKEKVQVAVMGSFGTDGKMDLDTLNKNLNQVEGIDKEKSKLPITSLPATVLVDDYKITIGEKAQVIVEGQNLGNDDNKTLPSTADTKPFLPEGAQKIEGTNLDTGLVIKDSNDNEWVWVEVPKSIYSEVTTSTDYTEIETAMQNYASNYRQSAWVDTFYSTEQHGFTNEIEYNNHKNSMLESVFENGGFYIGRYETGSETPRFLASDSLTMPIIQRDAYPYNWVTCRQAQEKATELTTGGKTTSLMFGIQWDLVMKFIEDKGVKSQEELKTNSTEWGNYNNATFAITRGFYTTSPTISGSWNQVKVTTKYTKPSSTSTLLTTGASDRNSVLGIYDLAGNIWEWTLEKSSDSNNPSANRGGTYNDFGAEYTASYRGYNTMVQSIYYIGSRVALW